MSSVVRGFSQIPNASKYMFVPFAKNHGGFTQADLDSVISGNPELVIQYDGTILNSSNAWNLIGNIDYDNAVNSIAAGDIYRDMGKQLHIMQDGVKIASFRYGQKVDDGNNGAEGVGSHPNLWLCTWVGAGPYCPESYGMVKVVRTG